MRPAVVVVSAISAPSPHPFPLQTMTHPQIPLESLKVQPARLLIIVRVHLETDPRIVQDRHVVPVRRGGQVHRLVVRVEALDELGPDAEGARARDGLYDGDLEGSPPGGVEVKGELTCSVVRRDSARTACREASAGPKGREECTYPTFLERSAVFAVREDGSLLREALESLDREILLVVLFRNDNLIRLSPAKRTVSASQSPSAAPQALLLPPTRSEDGTTSPLTFLTDAST